MNIFKGLTNNAFIKKNDSTIVACIGAVGVGVTIFLAIRDTIKAKRIVDVYENGRHKENPDYEGLTKKETALLVWDSYIPTVCAGIGTISCILWANSMSREHQVSLTGAYMLLNSTFDDYKEKVNDLFGENSDIQIQEELCKSNFLKSNMAIQTSESEYVAMDVFDMDEPLLFYEPYSGQYFTKTQREMEEIEAIFNKLFRDRGWAELSELCYLLGLPSTVSGDVLGWSLENGDPYRYANGDTKNAFIDFWSMLVKMDENLNCYIIQAIPEPTADYIDYI